MGSVFEFQPCREANNDIWQADTFGRPASDIELQHGKRSPNLDPDHRDETVSTVKESDDPNSHAQGTSWLREPPHGLR
jgi:hypothetical protein